MLSAPSSPRNQSLVKKYKNPGDFDDIYVNLPSDYEEENLQVKQKMPRNEKIKLLWNTSLSESDSDSNYDNIKEEEVITS